MIQKWQRRASSQKKKKLKKKKNMENVVSAAGKGDLHACKAALRVALSPALVAEVAALVEAGGGGNAAGSLACIQYFLKCGACLDARKARFFCKR